MRYSGAVINKLLGMPTDPQPNQFYLIETGGESKLYLSDSKSNLILLNTTVGKYRELIYTLNGTGGFDFIVDSTGAPIYTLSQLE